MILNDLFNGLSLKMKYANLDFSNNILDLSAWSEIALSISDKDDRRNYSRVVFTTKIEIHMLDESRQKVQFVAKSKDLSQRGLFVKTHKRPSLDTTCQVTVYLSRGIDDLKLDIQGRIVRHTDAGFGVEFESMDVDTYTHLKTLVLYNIEGND